MEKRVAAQGVSDKDVGAAYSPQPNKTWTVDMERRIVRKLDMILIPLMFLGYSLVYYDKAILGGATVFGLATDLKLRLPIAGTRPVKYDTSRLSWATSLFYFGMLVGLFPLTYLFQRFPIGRTVGSFVVIWGVVAMSTAGVTTWQGLYAQRFFLGFTESIVPTAFMVLISGYYTQAEQTWRQCLWYSSTGGMTVVGALINYGFAHVSPNHPLRSWQYLYLFAGSLTVLFGIAMFFVPSTPAEAWWFNEEEKLVAVERLRSGQIGMRCQKIKWYQIREALLDVRLNLIALMMGIAYVINGAISGFGPLIVSTFGWSAYASLLWQMPLGAVCFILILLVGYLSLKIPNIRLIMLAACCLPVIAGSVMIWKASWFYHASAPIAGYSILGSFAPVTSLIVSLSMANTAGNSKKSYAAAAVFVWYNVGNIVGPQLIVTQTVAQHYPRLWSSVIVCYALLVVLSGVLYVLFKRENARRERLGLNREEGEKIAFDDLTDRENMYFRYAY